MTAKPIDHPMKNDARKPAAKLIRSDLRIIALPASILHNARLITALAGIFVVSTTNASDAQTSATAGNHGRGPGTASATANYEGDVGWAHTDARSGRVNIARGVAVGVDENGLSLSLSNAVSTQHGPAIATNLNMSIGRDGDVSVSGGHAVARGPVQQSVYAGGGAGNGRAATAAAGGSTDRLGRVDARTHARDYRPVQRVTRLRRW